MTVKKMIKFLKTCDPKAVVATERPGVPGEYIAVLWTGTGKAPVIQYPHYEPKEVEAVVLR